MSYVNTRKEYAPHSWRAGHYNFEMVQDNELLNTVADHESRVMKDGWDNPVIFNHMFVR